MSNRTLADEIITLIESKSNNNPAPILCTIIGNYNEEPDKVDVKTDTGIFKYIKLIGSNTIDSDGLLVFVDGNYNNPLVINTSPKTNDAIDLSEIYSSIENLNDGLQVKADKNEIPVNISQLNDNIGFMKVVRLNVDYDDIGRYCGRTPDNAIIMDYLRDMTDIDEFDENTIYMIGDLEKIREMTENDDFSEKGFHKYVYIPETASPYGRDWLEEF